MTLLHAVHCASIALIIGLLGIASTVHAQATNTSPQAPAGNASAPGPPAGGSPFRRSPPQPTLKQSLDYFVGTWTATWSGRESAFSPGPRTGTVTYTRIAESPFLEMRGEGKVEGGGAYKESGRIGWHEAQKIVAWHERTAGGVEVLGIGDWTSPISIRFQTAPVTVQGKPMHLRRTVGIVSPTSFTVTDEISADGQTWSRIGNGVFGKTSAAR